MRILVTGGAGYIGSHYVQYEQGQGNDVFVLDNLIYGHKEAVAGVPLFVGNVGNAELLRTIFTENSIDAVVHFAAYASVGESVSYPDRYFHNNVVETLTLLDTMRECGVNYIVFSSSCATYGNPVTVPMDETHPQKPVNPYGESKLFCEHMMKAYDVAYGLRFTALRYFNAAGADPEGKIGESHDPETHIIPNILHAALGKKSHITVFGTDYDTPDGTCIRDYIHILDLAQAHSLALNRMVNGGESRQYNLGSEMGYSVNELIEMCQEITGRAINVEYGDRRPGDPPRLVASASKAKSELGWLPSFHSLSGIIETAWNWELNRKY